MWLNGPSWSSVTWFQIRDDYRPELPKRAEYTAGLYFRCLSGPSCDKPKPALTAFRFPFVAFKSRGGEVAVWGRTPAGRRPRPWSSSAATATGAARASARTGSGSSERACMRAPGRSERPVRAPGRSRSRCTAPRTFT